MYVAFEELVCKPIHSGATSLEKELISIQSQEYIAEHGSSDLR